jgi:hypothetical protein
MGNRFWSTSGLRVSCITTFPTFHPSDSDSRCCDAWFWDEPSWGESVGFERSFVRELTSRCSFIDFESKHSPFREKVTENPVEMIETPFSWPQIPSENSLAVTENPIPFWWCKIPPPYSFAFPVEEISHNICVQYRGSFLNSTKPEVAGFQSVVFLNKFPIEWVNSFKCSIPESEHILLNARVWIVKPMKSNHFWNLGNVRESVWIKFANLSVLFWFRLERFRVVWRLHFPRVLENIFELREDEFFWHCLIFFIQKFSLIRVLSWFLGCRFFSDS